MAAGRVWIDPNDRWRESDQPVVSPPEFDCRVEVMAGPDDWRQAGYAKPRAEAEAAAHSYRTDAGLPARAVGPDGLLPWRPCQGTVDLARKLLAAGPAVEHRTAQPGRAEAELQTAGCIVAVGGGVYAPQPFKLAAAVSDWS